MSLTTASFPDQPTFVADAGLPPSYRYEPTRVLVADVDGDPDEEMILISRRDDFGGVQLGGRTMLVLNLVGGDISTASFSYLEAEFADSSATLKGGGVYDVNVVDFDRDGKKEIWVFTWDLFSLAIYEATGPNTYALQTDINTARPDNDVGARHSMVFYDTDGDGKLEMYVAGITDASNPGNIHFIGSTDDVATLSSASVVTLTPDLEPVNSWSYEAASIGDLDGNGKMDYIIAGAGRREIFRYEYLGGPVADSLSYRMTTIYKDTASEHADWVLQFLWMGQDLDGDGKKEIVITNRNPRPDMDDERIIILEMQSGTGVGGPEGGMPASFVLEQNYPESLQSEHDDPVHIAGAVARDAHRVRRAGARGCDAHAGGGGSRPSRSGVRRRGPCERGVRVQDHRRWVHPGPDPDGLAVGLTPRFAVG